MNFVRVDESSMRVSSARYSNSLRCFRSIFPYDIYMAINAKFNKSVIRKRALFEIKALPLPFRIKPSALYPCLSEARYVAKF